MILDTKEQLKQVLVLEPKRLSVFEDPTQLPSKLINKSKRLKFKKFNKSMSSSGAIDMFNVSNPKDTINEKTQEDEEVKSSYNLKTKNGK